VGFPGVSGAASVGVAGSDATELADVPAAFAAVEVNVCAVPFVKPVTGHEVAGTVTVHVAPPGEAVTV